MLVNCEHYLVAYLSQTNYKVFERRKTGKVRGSLKIVRKVKTRYYASR